MAVKDVSHKQKRVEQEEGVSKIKAFFNYFSSARGELRKVSWPTRKETMVTGVTVFVVVLVVSLFLGLVDFVISGVVRYLLSL